jgi:hypothetical protein
MRQCKEFPRRPARKRTITAAAPAKPPNNPPAGRIIQRIILSSF